MKLPLEGIRVLDITGAWAGPHATMIMADWGAEVIRVESTQFFPATTRGHLVRVPKALPRARKGWGWSYPDWDPGEQPWNRFPIFQSHARNKLSMSVDMDRPEGLQVFHHMLAVSDVFVENNVPETIEKLHITYEELLKVKPDLIMLRMPAYGLNGPYKNYRSYGTHLEATSGHTWIRGYADMDPSLRDDVFMGDAAGGVNGAFAVLLALRHRRRTGKGQHIELSQAEAFIPYLGSTIMDYIMNARVHNALGNRHAHMAPHGAYRCQGKDKWVTICVASDGEWRSLCEAMGSPAWCQETKFSNCLGRWRHQDELDKRIEEWTSQCSPREVMELLQSHGVTACPVLDDRDLYEDPHMNAQGFFETLTHRECGTHRYPGIMWTMDGVANNIRTPPCCLGENNPYVYKELLGVSPGEYARLETTGHIGTAYASTLR